MTHGIEVGTFFFFVCLFSFHLTTYVCSPGFMFLDASIKLM